MLCFYDNNILTLIEYSIKVYSGLPCIVVGKPLTDRSLVGYDLSAVKLPLCVPSHRKGSREAAELPISPRSGLATIVALPL